MIILLRIVCIQSGITSPKLPPIAVQYTGHVYHVTTIPQCYWRKLLWRHTRLYGLYIRFGIILTQFYINFSRQEHQIGVLYESFNSWDSQVSSYTPFHFSFTVPLRPRLFLSSFYCHLVSSVEMNISVFLFSCLYVNILTIEYHPSILYRINRVFTFL